MTRQVVNEPFYVLGRSSDSSGEESLVAILGKLLEEVIVFLFVSGHHINPVGAVNMNINKTRDKNTFRLTVLDISHLTRFRIESDKIESLFAGSVGNKRLFEFIHDFA
jgi:hypothetical protein